MKMMHGALSLACSNRSRTRAAPTPTNISTNSEPDRVKKGTSASPATARARSVLPVPGGPTRRTPLGIRPPSRWYFLGFFRKSTISTSSALASSTPGDVDEGGLELLAIEDLVLGAPERQGLRRPAADPSHQEHPDGDHDAQRDDPSEEKVADERRLDTAGELDLVLFELCDERRLVDAGDPRHGEDPHFGVGAEPLAQPVTGPAGRCGQGVGLGETADLLLRQGDFLDLVGADELEELRHRDLDRARGLQPGLEQEKDHGRDQHVGQRELDALVEPRPHGCPHSPC